MGPRPAGKKTTKKTHNYSKKAKYEYEEKDIDKYPPNIDTLKAFFRHLSQNINGKKISIKTELNHIKTSKYIEYFPDNIIILKNFQENYIGKDLIGIKSKRKNELDEKIVQLNVKEENILERLQQIKEDETSFTKLLDNAHEVNRPKSHWDYLLAEMKWLADDFQREKSWKRVAAKKLVNSAAKVMKERVNRENKEAKQETFKVKRQCANIAKMVKDWWKQMEKIVLAKQQLRLNAKHQEAVTSHLGKVLETTEKYTEWLTEDLKKQSNMGEVNENDEGDDNNGAIDNDPEFKVDPEVLQSDDEETIEKDEEMMITEEQKQEQDVEVEKLTQESNLELDALLDSLPEEYKAYLMTGKDEHASDEQNKMEAENQTEDASSSDESVTSNDSDDDDDDDEETLIEQEKYENKKSTQIELKDNELSKNDASNADNPVDNNANDNDEDDGDELSKLAKDADIPMEDLIQMYNDSMEVGVESAGEVSGSTTSLAAASDMLGKSSASSSSSSSSDDDGEDMLDDADDSRKTSDIDLKDVFQEEKKEEVAPVVKSETKEEFSFEGEFKALTEEALSTLPKGYTIESAGGVKVKVPHLIRHTLREYQHVGLDWLAAIYEKRFNGILADEMGLGKTIQTIALLAYMACEKSIWGPHLIVVPTSVILNWEMEFKKWCPGFKLLTYYGSAKERRDKRKGWTKTNAFHICITSYKLAIQDSLVFKRKKWKYFILDEAQNIKNFKSKRWQTLLTFNSQRRLLLTGTPLQNNLMELWSLMHFLMPHIFQSHKEFQEWFGSPLTGMIEGNSEYNEQLVKRLHKVLRPFILRRLKKDVEKQMPKKYEHVIMCHLSKRQRCLYDDFMSLNSTQETLSGGQFLSVINILMQLRKVCNHPNLFESRPINSPFLLLDNNSNSSCSFRFESPRCCYFIDQHKSYSYNRCNVGLNLVDMSRNLSKFVAERIFKLKPRPGLIEEIDDIQVSDWDTDFRLKYVGNTNSRISRPLFTRPMFTVDESQLNHIPLDPIYCHESPQPSYIPKCSSKRESLGLRVITGTKRRLDSASSSASLPASILELRSLTRQKALQSMITFNEQHISLISHTYLTLYGPDLRKAVCFTKYNTTLPDCNDGNSPMYRDLFSVNRLLYGRNFQQMLSDSLPLIRLFKFNVTSVLSFGIKTTKSILAQQKDKNFSETLVPVFKSRLPPEFFESRTKDLLQFPETRLIQYDCGKLQTMEVLLKRLHKENHRCLVFTQMTRMLDILEHFLSYLGYRYLRLDGSTKVEQRQFLMETFNQDARIFVFILSTRSGGLGVNLTGADTVIFYDSDWNPTMDAQAQDRCHRIGQTRDVHIYRLISKMTVEENILKKANQKRTLSDMAIEGGQFNTGFFKSNTLKDLFQAPSGLEEFADKNPKDKVIPKVEESQSSANAPSLIRTRSGREVAWKGPPLNCSAQKTTVATDSSEVPAKSGVKEDNGTILAVSAEFEAALEQIEDDNDLEAAHRAAAEEKADLEEFNEDIPWDENEQQNKQKDEEENGNTTIRLETERQIKEFESQLNPIQRFGVQMVELNVEDTLTDQLEMAQQTLESSKKTWHLEQLKALHEADEFQAQVDEDDMFYCYGKYDISAQKRELERIKKQEAKEKHNQVDSYNNGDSVAGTSSGYSGKAVLSEKVLEDTNWLRKQHLIAMKRKHSDQQLKQMPSSSKAIKRGFINYEDDDCDDEDEDEYDDYGGSCNKRPKMMMSRTDSVSSLSSGNIDPSFMSPSPNAKNLSGKNFNNKCPIQPVRSALFNRFRQNHPNNHNSSSSMTPNQYNRPQYTTSSSTFVHQAQSRIRHPTSTSKHQSYTGNINIQNAGTSQSKGTTRKMTPSHFTHTNNSNYKQTHHNQLMYINNSGHLISKQQQQQQQPVSNINTTGLAYRQQVSQVIPSNGSLLNVFSDATPLTNSLDSKQKFYSTPSMTTIDTPTVTISTKKHQPQILTIPKVVTPNSTTQLTYNTTQLPYNTTQLPYNSQPRFIIPSSSLSYSSSSGTGSISSSSYVKTQPPISTSALPSSSATTVHIPLQIRPQHPTPQQQPQHIIINPSQPVLFINRPMAPSNAYIPRMVTSQTTQPATSLIQIINQHQHQQTLSTVPIATHNQRAPSSTSWQQQQQPPTTIRLSAQQQYTTNTPIRSVQQQQQQQPAQSQPQSNIITINTPYIHSLNSTFSSNASPTANVSILPASTSVTNGSSHFKSPYHTIAIKPAPPMPTITNIGTINTSNNNNNSNNTHYITLAQPTNNLNNNNTAATTHIRK